MGTESMKDKTEGTLKKAMGQVKEPAGSLAENKALKAAGGVIRLRGCSRRRVLQKSS